MALKTYNPLVFIACLLYKKDYYSINNKLSDIYRTNLFAFDSRQTEILKKILISGEDHRFKYHLGFDILAIMRAIRNRILYHKKEGASTIEQQLVRVLTNDFRKTFKRKLKEILLATTLRYIVPRKTIPLIYLKVAYYGTNMVGFESVLKRLDIFNTNLITEEIAAEIIARIKYPEPKNLSENRANQISLRKKHLLKLYNNHKNRKFIKVYG